MLKHIVAVNLNYSEGDPKIAEFFEAAKELLEPIPQVKSISNYRVQNSESCGYTYGFILDFDSVEALQQYMESPRHLEFANNQWEAAVKDVVDINFIPMV